MSNYSAPLDVIKGWSTEFSQQLVQLAVQIHGGMGYIEETGVAQNIKAEKTNMAFYEQKILTSLFYVEHVLPQSEAHVRIVVNGGSSFRSVFNAMVTCCQLPSLESLC